MKTKNVILVATLLVCGLCGTVITRARNLPASDFRAVEADESASPLFSEEAKPNRSDESDGSVYAYKLRGDLPQSRIGGTS